jgi:hypothetical protein
MIRQKHIVLIILFLLVMSSIICYFAFVPQQNSPITQVPITQTDNQITSTAPAITIKDMQLHESEKKKGYELIVNAKESQFNQIANTIECNTVTCSIFQHGIHVAHINSSKSLIDRVSKNVTFAGSVHGLFKELTMHGSDICYNFSTNTVQTDKTMTYTHPFFNFSAKQCNVNIASQKIIMGNGVRSEFLYSAASHNSHQ